MRLPPRVNSLATTEPTGRSRSPSPSNAMVEPSGIANQRFFPAPSDQKGALTW